MGTSKSERKYGKKPKEETVKYKVLINNHYFLDGFYDSWESADLAGKKHTRGKRMSYVVVTGV